jgi:hypothetical protein
MILVLLSFISIAYSQVEFSQLLDKKMILFNHKIFKVKPEAVRKFHTIENEKGYAEIGDSHYVFKLEQNIEDNSATFIELYKALPDKTSFNLSRKRKDVHELHKYHTNIGTFNESGKLTSYAKCISRKIEFTYITSEEEVKEKSPYFQSCKVITPKFCTELKKSFPKNKFYTTKYLKRMNGFQARLKDDKSFLEAANYAFNLAHKEYDKANGINWRSIASLAETKELPILSNVNPSSTKGFRPNYYIRLERKKDANVLATREMRELRDLCEEHSKLF